MTNRPEQSRHEPGGHEPPGNEVARRAPTLPGRPADADAARVAGRRRIVVGAASVVGRAATHERTRDTGRWVARNTIVYPLTGVFVLVRRWWEARTNARYERLMRGAADASEGWRFTLTRRTSKPVCTSRSVACR